MHTNADSGLNDKKFRHLTVYIGADGSSNVTLEK